MLQIHALFRSFLPQPSKNAKQNLNPIYTDAPRFVRSVVNGKLYTVGTGEDAFDIVRSCLGYVIISVPLLRQHRYSDFLSSSVMAKHMFLLDYTSFEHKPKYHYFRQLFFIIKVKKIRKLVFLIIKANSRIKHKPNC